MPKLEFSENFAHDLASITSPKIEALIFEYLEHIEQFGEFGSTVLPKSIQKNFGNNVRKIAVNPFDLIYTFYPEKDLARIEALVPQRSAW